MLFPHFSTNLVNEMENLALILHGFGGMGRGLDGQTDGQTDGYREGLMDGQTDGRL